MIRMKKVIPTAEKQAFKSQNHNNITHKTLRIETSQRKKASQGGGTYHGQLVWLTTGPWQPTRAVHGSGCPVPSLVPLRGFIFIHLSQGSCYGVFVLGHFGPS